MYFSMSSHLTKLSFSGSKVKVNRVITWHSGISSALVTACLYPAVGSLESIAFNKLVIVRVKGQGQQGLTWHSGISSALVTACLYSGVGSLESRAFDKVVIADKSSSCKDNQNGFNFSDLNGSKSEVCHEKMCLKIFVVVMKATEYNFIVSVIPKEGLAKPRPPILLWVWQRQRS